MVGLAQMVRASDCGPEGRWFDSSIPPHVMATGRWNFRLTASAPAATIPVSHPMSSLAAERLFFDGFDGF